MLLKDWQNVIVQWVNCLDVIDMQINHVDELPLDTFFQGISRYLKCTEEGGIYDSITEFLHNEFPGFDFNHVAVTPLSDDKTELTYILSLLLFHCFVKCDKGELHHVMCERLDSVCQEVLKDFLCHLYDKSINRNNVIAAMESVKMNTTENPSNVGNCSRMSYSFSDTPKSRTPYVYFTTPSCHGQKLELQARQLKKLKMELEIEVSEKLDLREQLLVEKEKTKNLNIKLGEKRDIINRLQEDLNQNVTVCPHKDKDVYEKSLHSEIKSLQKYIEDLQKEFDPLLEERDSLKRQLSTAEQCHKMWQKRAEESDVDLEKVSQMLQEKNHELAATQEICNEQQKHIQGMRNEFNRSIESDESTLEHLFSPERVVERVPLSQTVIDVILKEKEAENMELKQKIEQLEEKSLELTTYNNLLKQSLDTYMEDCRVLQSKLDSALSNVEILSEGKLSLEKELESLKNVLQEVENKLTAHMNLVSSFEREVEDLKVKLMESKNQADILATNNSKLQTDLQTIHCCVSSNLEEVDKILHIMMASYMGSYAEDSVHSFNINESISINDLAQVLNTYVRNLGMESKQIVENYNKVVHSCTDLSSKLSHFEDALTTLQTEKHTLLLEKDRLSSCLSEVEEAKAQCELKIEQLTSEIDEKLNVLYLLKQDVCTYESKCGQLEQLQKATEERLQKTINDLEDAKFEKDNFVELHEQLKRESDEERSSLMAHANELQTKLAYEAEVLISFQSNFEEIKQQYATVVNDLDQLSREYSLLKEERTSLQGILHMRECELTQLNSQLKSLMSNNDTMQQQLNSTKEDILAKSQLLFDIETLYSQINESVCVAMAKLCKHKRSDVENVSLQLESIEDLKSSDGDADCLSMKFHNLKQQILAFIQEYNSIQECFDILTQNMIGLKMNRDNQLGMDNDVSETNIINTVKLCSEINEVKSYIVVLENEIQLSNMLSQSLQNKVTEMAQNEDDLAAKYKIASDGYTKQIAQLTSHISELESNLTLLGTENSKINEKLHNTQSELVEINQCNRKQAEEMQRVISASEQNEKEMTKKWEVQLKDCENERDDTINMMKEDFEKEKDRIHETACKISSALQQEIDKLESLKHEMQDELQEIKTNLTSVINQLEDTLSEKSSLMQRIEEVEIERTAEVTTRTILEKQLAVEKNTLQETIDQFSVMRESLETTIAELCESKECLMKTYSLTCSLNEEHVKKLKDEINELKSNISCITLEKKEFNEKLRATQSKLIDMTASNKSLAVAIAEKEQRLIELKNESELQLQTCKDTCSETINMLKEDFEQEKVSINQAGSEISSALHQEIEKLILLKIEMEGELQEVKSNLTYKVNQFEDTLAEKSTLLQQIEKIEIERTTDLLTQMTVVKQLAVKNTLQKTIDQFSAVRESLEITIVKLAKSKESLLKSHTLSCIVNEEHTKKLADKIKGLESNLSLLTSEKQEMNETLRTTHNELVEVRDCNKSQAEEMQNIISENEQKLIVLKNECEQQLKTCEHKYCEIIKMLKDDFEQEKVSINLAASEISSAFQQEIEKLTLLKIELEGELQEVKSSLTSTVNQLEDTLSAKSSLLQHIEEVELKRTAEVMTRTALEKQLAVEKDTLQEKISQFSAMKESLDTTVAELTESKESLMTIYTLACHVNEENVKKLTGEINELKSNISLLKSEKEKINETLQATHNDLAEVRAYNKSQTEEIQNIISENDKKLIVLRNECEQQLKTCENKHNEIIKMLTVNFEQEKVSLSQSASKISSAFQLEIEKLSSFKNEMQDEFKEIKSNLTNKVNQLEDPLFEKVQHIKDLEIEQTAEVTQTALEKQLTLQETIDQFSAMRESLDTTIAELNTSKESLIKIYTLVCSMNEEQVKKLTSEVVELKSSLSSIKSEKEELNEKLRTTQHELVEVRDCNKSQAEEMQKIISENEQNMLKAKCDYKQHLKQCLEETNDIVRALQVELSEIKGELAAVKEKFTEELQEKDNTIQATQHNGHSLQEQIKTLCTEKEKINDELQHVQFVLTETMMTLDERTAEKRALLNQVEDIETERNAEVVICKSLEQQLNGVQNKLQEEMLHIAIVKRQNELLANLVVSVRDRLIKLRASSSVSLDTEVNKIDGCKSIVQINDVPKITACEGTGRDSVDSTQACQSSDLPMASLLPASLEADLCSLADGKIIDANMTTVCKELLTFLDTCELNIAITVEAKIIAETQLIYSAKQFVTLQQELNMQLEASKFEVDQLEICLKDTKNKENSLQSEVSDLKMSNDTLLVTLDEQKKQASFLGDSLLTINVDKDMAMFKTAVLQQRNDQLKKTVEDILMHHYNNDFERWKRHSFKKSSVLSYHDVISSRKLMEQKLYDLCNSIHQVNTMYTDSSSDEIKALLPLEMDVDNILNSIEEQAVQLHIKLLNTFVYYIESFEYETELGSIQILGEENILTEVKDISDAEVKNLQYEIKNLQLKVNSILSMVKPTNTNVPDRSLIKSEPLKCFEDNGDVNLEDSLEERLSGSSTNTPLSDKLVRLEAMQNHSSELYHSIKNNWKDERSIHMTFLNIGKCSLSALHMWLIDLHLANKRLCNEKNTALKNIRSLQEELNLKNESKASLEKAYLKVVDENDKVRSDFASVTARFIHQEKEKQQLQKELQVRYTEGDLQQKCDLLGKEYEEKLQRMKQKMTTLFKEEMTKIEPVKKNNERLELLCKKYTEKITRYEEYTKNINAEMTRLKDDLQSLTMDKKFLQQQVATLKLGKEARSLLETTGPLGSKPDCGILCNEDNTIIQTHVQRAVNFIDETEDCVIYSRRKSLVQKSLAQDLRQAFTEEDEAGEEFNNTYLADMKAGRIRLPEPDKRRLTELQYRNSLCLPHLKSSYPAETQFSDPRDFRDDDIKVGFGVDEGDSSSLSMLLPGERHRKKDRGQTSYQKPGPPTPVKNGGRRSLQASDTFSPRLALRDQNENTGNRTKGSTPSRIRALFSSKHSKRDMENTPITPRGRRLSIFRK